MSKNSTLNIRVDADVRDRSKLILERMGLTFSEAFNLMLHQVCIQKALPFDVVSYSHTPSTETFALIDRIESGEEKLHHFATWEEAEEWLDA